uniref:Uncharacterized protein n=1 Tax=Rhizophora mucronata TaxID=61149 RepID=A0A2P2MZH4_RHIMU
MMANSCPLVQYQLGLLHLPFALVPVLSSSILPP